LVRVLAEDLDDRTPAAWLGAGSAQVDQLVPELGERLGAAALPPAASGSPEAARFSLFEAVAGFLRRAAAVQPLMLVLEDLQAADASSLLLLEFLARDLRRARLLVVGTYRNLTADRVRGIGDAIGQLVREGHLLSLRGLARREVRARLNVTRAIRTAMANLARAHPALGRHLSSTIRTGRYCSYVPDPRVPITWER
jgi:AAA ATPase-like protein